MQGNDNFVRTYKSNEGKPLKDRKRDKHRAKDQRKQVRKMREKEMEMEE